MKTTEILSNLGITALNAMQQEMHETCRKQREVVLLSPTGSGKTLAYLIPIVQRVDTASNDVQVLVLLPSRELAMQSALVLKQMKCGVRGLAVYGGRPAMDEHRTMNALRPHIVFGTPGRVLDHLQKENFDGKTVRTLVIDEFDKCLELGFQEQMADVLRLLPQVESRILLSATDCPQIPLFVGTGEGVRKLDFLDDEAHADGRIEQYVVTSPVKDKLETLARLLCALGDTSSLVFVGYRESVARVAKYLSGLHFNVSAFHGGMEQDHRERALFRFSSGACNVLVCTDLAARGLDIPAIDNIIHYHLPADEQAFIHRNGRTARWEANGHAYTILSPEEYLPDFMPQDMPVRQLNLRQEIIAPRSKWESLYIGKGKKDKLSKGDIAGFMMKIGGLERDEVGSIEVRDHHAYVSISRPRVKELLLRIRGQKIKGMKTIIEITR